jgi:glycosyltransferase involved in cell wall biosynthesis
MTATPRASVGLPVYNGEAFIADALDSVLAQTFDEWEVIICDNASTDGTAEICMAYVEKDERIRYYRNETNLGASKNYERTYELSSGEYFCWLPSDDAMEPDFLARCVDMLDNDPEVVNAFSQYLIRSGTDAPVSHEISLDSDMRFVSTYQRVRKLFRERIIGPNWPMFGVYRSSILKDTGRLRPMIGADDYLTLEVALMGQVGQVPEQLYVIRTHPDAWHVARESKGKGLLARLLGTETVWAAAWFDPANEKMRVVFPHWRRLQVFASLIMRSKTGFGEKLKMLGLLPVYAVQHWRRLAKELVGGVAQLIVVPLRALKKSPTPS